MKASCRWLRELVPGLDASVEEIARRLTHAGIEVEAIEEFGEGTKSLVVAEVLAFEPHPSRPKLRLVSQSKATFMGVLPVAKDDGSKLLQAVWTIY